MNYKHSYGSRKNTGWVVVAFVPIFVLVVMWGSMFTVNHDINIISKERNELADKKSKLTLELDAMNSNRRMEEVAVARYGFKKPSDGQVLVLKKQISLFDVFTGGR